MDYYLNEYSLRGQFKDIEEFYKSLRMKTLPVFKKIKEQKESVIWKKDTFWQSEICPGISLMNIPKKKNERTAELTILKAQLRRLVQEGPFWEGFSKPDLEIKEYQFDNEYRGSFEEDNCFIKAIENEGRIVSFIHPNYNSTKLSVIIKYDGSNDQCDIDNIFDCSWWKIEPEIKTWDVEQKYKIEIRAKEYEYHPPHFHASRNRNEYEAVFKLSSGELYKDGKKKWTSQMVAEIQAWYQEHKEELQKAWECLHN